MARIEQGILGGGRGAVGPVVMTKWKGKDVLRPRVTPSNPRTPKQVRQRRLFGRLTQAGSALMDGFVRPYWQQFAETGNGAQTAFNEFVRTNMAVMRSPLADLTGAPAGQFDAAQLLLTRGPVPAADPTGAVDDDGQVRVEWDAAGDALAFPDDGIALVVTDLTGTPVALADGSTRQAGAATVNVPYADRGRYAFHVVPYRLDDQDNREVIVRAGFHGSLRFEEGLDGMAGNPVIVTGQAKRAAVLGRDNSEVAMVKPKGLLGTGRQSLRPYEAPDEVPPDDSPPRSGGEPMHRLRPAKTKADKAADERGD